MRAGRTTNIASVISLLGAFLATALVMGLLVAGVAMPAVGAIGTAARSGIDVFDSLPDTFTAAPLSQQSRILAADGSLLATPYDENRVIVPLSGVSTIMRKAQVAIEDNRFYEHGGIDTRGLVRAMVSNAQGDVVQGGSTLTQQYVKLLLQETAIKNGDEQAAAAATARSGLAGVTRKLQELKYSVQLEKTLTKDQILQGYLNISYYGDQAYGVEAASEHYFGHSAKALNYVESALLAGLTQNPGTTDPVNFPAKAQARRNVVLDRMYALNIISLKDRDSAKALPIAKMLHVTPAQNSCAKAGTNAYFCDYAVNYVLQDPSFAATLGKTVAERKQKLYNGGLTIKTTLEPALAKSTRDAILAKVPLGNDQRNIKIGSAAVVTDPRTGGVRAIAQNTDYSNKTNPPWGQTSINWAVDQQYGGSGGFQFGSTEKAFTLVAALENGVPMNSTVNAAFAGPGNYHNYTSAEIPNTDGCGLSPGQPPWRVKNDGSEGGVMTLAKATADSVNTAFITLANNVGICKVRDVEARVGLHRSNGTPIAPGPDGNSYPPDIILGGAEVSPMTVAAAYGSIANNGVHCTPDPIQSITDSTGKALAVPKPGEKNCTRVIDAGVAAGVAQLMTHVMTDGTGKGAKLANGRQSAGKTGTTNLNNETWFVGYTPQAVTAVWTGTPLENTSALDDISLAGSFYPVVYGLSISAPLWKQIMDTALAGQPNVDFPAVPDNIVNGNVQSFSAVGYSVADATASLEAQGYKVVVGRSIYSGYRPGVVASTSPAYKAPVGSTVTLLVSAGPNPNRAPTTTTGGTGGTTTGGTTTTGGAPPTGGAPANAAGG